MSAITRMRHLSKWIFIIVAIVFIGGFLMGELWQILGRRTGKNMLEKGIVGKVGKKNITLQEYRNVFEYFMVKYQTENKINNLTPQDYENINQQTWQYLTQQKIWEDIYKKGKIKITDAEIIEIMKANPPQNIRDDPEFKTADGNFDYEKYQNYLFAPENRLYTQLYARELADGLPKEKFRLDVLNSYRVTNSEVEEALKRENTGIKLTYLYFSSRLLKERYTPTENEIKDYYNKHKDKYLQKEMFRVRYVFFNKAISQRDSIDAQRQIEDAYSLTKTDEFNNLIRDFSDNPNDSVAHWVRLKDLDSIARGAIISLKNDSITPPFLNLQGWQIIKVDQRKKDSVLIRKIVKSIKITQESEYALRDSVSNFVNQARSTDFDTLCLQYGLMPREMAPMTKERINFPALFNQNQLKEFVLSAKPKSVSQPMKARNGYYVFQLISAEPKKIQPLEQVKVSIEWEIRRTKEKEIIREYAKTFSDKIRSRIPLESIAKLDTLIELRTEEFNSYKDCRNRKGSEFAGTAYALEPNETSDLLFTEIGVFVIRCDEKKPNQLLTREQYIENRRTEVGNRIFQNALKQPEIIDYRDNTFF